MKFFALIIICFFGLFTFGQNNATSNLLQKLEQYSKDDTTKVNLLLQLGATYYGTDAKKLIDYSNQAKELSTHLNYKKGLAEALKLQGAANISLGDFKKAETYFQESLNKYKEINYNPGIVICYSNLGTVKLLQNSYPEALKLFQTSIRYAEKANDFKNAAYAYVNTGIIYNELKDYNQALDQYRLALQNHEKAKNDNGIAAAYSNIGTVYFSRDDFENAKKYYELALTKNQEIGNRFSIAREYGNLASVYMKKNQYDKAYTYLTDALAINQELNNKKGIASIYEGFGEYYLHDGNRKVASDYFIKALEIAKEIGTRDIEKSTYKGLSELHEKDKNMDSAYFYFKKYIDVKESIDNENNRKQISRLEVQYEFDVKEERYKNQLLLDQEYLKQNQLLLDINILKLNQSNKERDLVHLNYLQSQSNLKNEQLESDFQEKQLEIKQNEIEVNNLKLAAKERQKWLYIFGIGFLTILGVLLYYQNQLKKKNNEYLKKLNSELNEANKVKTKFMAILNHDLRSPVSRLIHFLHLQKESPELLDDVTKKRLNDQAKLQAENLLGQMEELLIWSKSQMDRFSLDKRIFTVELLFNELKTEFNWVDNSNIFWDYKEEQSLFTDKEYLKTILRNIINNAVNSLKDKKNGEIVVKADEVKEYYLISVTNNGGGTNLENFRALFSDQENISSRNGLGLHLVRDMAKKIEAEISVDTDINKEETTITLQMQKQ